MALFNVMVLNSNLYPVVTAIGDCTGHLSKDGKKDALFIADVISGLLLNFDAEKTAWTYSTSTAHQMCRRPSLCLRSDFPGP